MVLEQDIQMASNSLCESDYFAAVIYNTSEAKSVNCFCLAFPLKLHLSPSSLI